MAWGYNRRQDKLRDLFITDRGADKPEYQGGRVVFSFKLFVRMYLCVHVSV